MSMTINFIVNLAHDFCTSLWWHIHKLDGDLYRICEMCGAPTNRFCEILKFNSNIVQINWIGVYFTLKRQINLVLNAGRCVCVLMAE